MAHLGLKRLVDGEGNISQCRRMTQWGARYMYVNTVIDVDIDKQLERYKGLKPCF